MLNPQYKSSDFRTYTQKLIDEFGMVFKLRINIVIPDFKSLYKNFIVISGLI